MRIDNTPSHITVHSEDGSIYAGDLVVGADGVHGVTHGEMCRNMTRSTLPPKLNYCTVTASYSGIFGTSTRTAGLAKGVAHWTYGHRFCFIVTVGKDERVHQLLPCTIGGSIAAAMGMGQVRLYRRRSSQSIPILSTTP